MVDIGNGLKIDPTHYRLSYSSGGRSIYPRNWKFQGTNNPSVRKKEKQT